MRPRKTRKRGQYAYVPLTRGYVAKIDAADIELVKDFSWFAAVTKRNVYAARSARVSDGKPGMIFMHRVILSADASEQVDHRNHDGLNNTRINLRACTHIENTHNQRKPSNNTSGFKGVSWNKPNQKWLAQIRIANKNRYLGSFDTPEDAHHAYCQASRELHGNYGHTG